MNVGSCVYVAHVAPYFLFNKRNRTKKLKKDFSSFRQDSSIFCYCRKRKKRKNPLPVSSNCLQLLKKKLLPFNSRKLKRLNRKRSLPASLARLSVSPKPASVRLQEKTVCLCSVGTRWPFKKGRRRNHTPVLQRPRTNDGFDKVVSSPCTSQHPICFRNYLFLPESADIWNRKAWKIREWISLNWRRIRVAVHSASSVSARRFAGCR